MMNHYQEIIVNELVGDRVDPSSNVAREQWRKMYEQVTEDCWKRLDHEKGGQRIIHLWCLRFGVSQDVENIIQEIHFFMVKSDLDKTVKALGNKMDVHSMMWDNRTTAAIACTDHRVVDRYVEICLNLRLPLWDLTTINILVYRHINLDSKGFPLIHFQRRLVNCTCGHCVGVWNLQQSQAPIFYPWCNCICPLCKRL